MADMDYVEYRLNDWAQWSLRKIDLGLGYPSKSIEGRLREMGGLLIKSNHYSNYLDNAPAEEIEELLAEMLLFNPISVGVLKIHYLKLGRTNNKANRLGISKSQYHVELGMAKSWLAGRLSNRRKN